MSLKATLAEEKPATMGALVKVLEAEMSPVFKECRSGTVTLNDLRELVKVAFGDKERVDVERMAFRLKVDLERNTHQT